MDQALKVTLLSSRFDNGGVERLIALIAQGLHIQGANVTILAPFKERDPFIQPLEKQIRTIRLNNSKNRAFAETLQQHLKQDQPDVLLLFRSHDPHIVMPICKKHPTNPKTIFVNGKMLSKRLDAKTSGWLKTLKWHYRIRKHWTQMDQIVCVSPAIVDDWLSTKLFDKAKLHYIPSPVITPETRMLALQPVQHSWFKHKNEPIILGAGRLTKNKNFPLLIHAFAKVRQKHNCKLVIIGEGELRAKLEQQITNLGLSDHIALLGFADNPYQYMAQADVFALSSCYEEYGLVLVEALAQGTPVVSIDCPIGPTIILKKGELGKLIPMGDIDAFAEALYETLQQAPAKEKLKQSVTEHNIENSSRAYWEFIKHTVYAEYSN